MESALESIRVHAEQGAAIEALQTQHAAHIASDMETHAKILEQLDHLVRYKIQLRTIVGIGLGLIVFIGAAGLAGGLKWTMRQAAQEVLIENGIIQLRRAP